MKKGVRKRRTRRVRTVPAHQKVNSFTLHSPPLPILQRTIFPIFLFSLHCSFVLHPSHSSSPYLHLSYAHPSLNLIVNYAGTGRMSVTDMGLGLPSPALLARDYRSVRAIQVPCTAPFNHHCLILLLLLHLLQL